MNDLAPFPSAQEERLRAEAHGMARAYVHAIRAALPRDAILGIWGKGSAYRPWDSLIDYVPEVSDVDIHVRLAPVGREHLGSLAPALETAERALRKFHALFPSPVHQPRPQLVYMHEIERRTRYVAPPVGTMHPLFGESAREHERDDFPDTVESDTLRFLEDARFVDRELAGKVIDRPGASAWRIVRRLTFRVAPVASRLLTRAGFSPFDAWSLNRTGLVRLLHERGYEGVADAYVSFYLAGWDGYRTRFADGAIAREALRSVGALYDAARPFFPDTEPDDRGGEP